MRKGLRISAERSISGSPIPAGSIKVLGADHHSLSALKAQNHLSYAMNYKLRTEGTGAGGSMSNPGIKNGTGIDTLPFFSSWYITGAHNSTYPYSMLGQNPKAGGTTGINNQVIPLITVLLYRGVPVATYDPTIANDPQGSDIALLEQSPLYDPTTTYPGPPADTGQVVDTELRASFNGIHAADWHTPLNPPMSSGTVWIQFLEYSNGDWTFACCDSHGNNFPVVNINVISNNFDFILTSEAPLNTTFPIIVTDYVTAFQPGGGCCVLGYHNSQPGITDPMGILVWAWGTFIPQSNNPFAPFGNDVMVLSHEISETYHDPFVATGGTSVSPWVDGSVSFAQANLEVGDVIEGMAAGDVIYNVPLTTSGGPYTYTIQNVALLPWFTRNPVNGGLYSWPNEHTLSQCTHVLGASPTWCYGEGSAGFYFGPPY